MRGKISAGESEQQILPLGEGFSGSKVGEVRRREQEKRRTKTNKGKEGSNK